MAGTPETVDNFLQPIMDATMRSAKAQLKEMEALAGHKIEAWDWCYYAEKLRVQKYALDESQTKPYFQADSVLKGVFTAAERIYDIKIEEAPEVEVYHPKSGPISSRMRTARSSASSTATIMSVPPSGAARG